MIQQHTKIDKIGVYEPPPSTVVIKNVIFDEMETTQGLIRKYFINKLLF